MIVIKYNIQKEDKFFWIWLRIDVAINFDELDVHNIDSARIYSQNKDILKSGFSVPCDFEMFPQNRKDDWFSF